MSTQSTLDTQYSEIMASQKQAHALENEKLVASGALPAFGVNWSLHRWQFDERPYVKASCSRCKSVYTTGELGFVFRHCGEAEVMPVELRDRLEALKHRWNRGVPQEPARREASAPRPAYDRDTDRI